MKKLFLTSAATLTVAASANAAIVANLFNDYTETGAVVGQTHTTVSGGSVWTFSQEGGSELTFDTDLGGTLIAGTPSGYSGTGIVFGNPGLGNFPHISDEGVFDGASPGANQLQFHPGGAGDALIITWTADQDYTNVSLDYDFDSGNDVGFTFGGTAGVTQARQTVTSTDFIGSINSTNGTVLAGQTIIFTLDQGGDDSPGGDQTFGNLIVNATAVPEPSSTALLGLGGVALLLRRRK